MLSLFPGTANGLDKIGRGELLPSCEVSGGDLGVDLDTRVWREKMVYTDSQFSMGSIVNKKNSPGMS